MSTDPSGRKAARNIRLTGIACLGVALSMMGVAFAAVPLYDLFCRVTGFNGTPMVGTSAPAATSERAVSVRFDANVATGLKWSFVPEVASVEAKLGETKTVFFRVRNEGSAASTGIAAFNVQPGQAGAFFVKLKCFCFEDQTLKPGESFDFPVVFYIDPAITENRSLDDLSAITLSYTYFTSRNGQPIASADAEAFAKPKL
jgi:cytochrome c oxidase assembly protein subunit 11